MNKTRGWDYMCLALYAFAGLGIEVLLAFLIEPFVYGGPMSEWSVLQNIVHWIITCILWGIVIFLLVKEAKRKYGFDIFAKTEKMKPLQWITAGVCVIFTLSMSYIDWGGFKVVKEFNYNGVLKFIFQYIYYVFETGLFALIIIFGQKAFEKWFGNKNFPYGGIVVALTWGAGHILTKGSLSAGLISALSGFIYGVTYLLVNRDIKKTYLLLFVMFVF
ncbi:MAG: hypothetical protein Q4D16_06155 [Eubacteriales bacterium]|nr:hypothetical protein [Eubacteriales bacterium]